MESTFVGVSLRFFLEVICFVLPIHSCVLSFVETD